MTQYLVYRHGSNAANQSMTQTMPLCIVEAKSRNEACLIVEEYHTFYGNQHSEAIPKSKARYSDWISVEMSDGMGHLDQCLPLPKNIVATKEPKLNYEEIYGDAEYYAKSIKSTFKKNVVV